MNNSYLSLIERNKRVPSLEMINKIANFLEVPLAVLFWFTVTEDDLEDDKKHLYATFKPTVDKIMIEMFDKR